MIPCKKNKCLKYPACRNSMYISCSAVSSHWYKLRDKYAIKYNVSNIPDPPEHIINQDAWNELKETLPKMIELFQDGVKR